MEMWKKYWIYIVALFLFFLVNLFLPAKNGLTQTGVQVLAVLIPTLVLWLFNSTDWPSLLALGGLIMTQCLTPTEVFQQSIGHPIIMTIIVCMALNACLMETGVIHKIAFWFITRSFIRGRPYAFWGMFLASYLILGIFMETLSLTVIYISIATAILSSLGFKKGDSFYTAMMLSILWGNAVATVASPISHALPMILMAQMENTMGIAISYGKWLSIGIPYLIMMYFIAMFILKYVWKPDAKKFLNYDLDAVKGKAKPLDANGKIAGSLFILLIIAWVFPEMGSSLAPALCAYMKAIGTCVPAIVVVSALCLIRVKDRPIARFKEITRNIPIGILIFTGTVTVFGNVINLESTGISRWLNSVLMPLASGMSPFLLIGILLFGVLVFTNFLSNTVAMLLFFNIALSLLGNTGVNLVAFSLLIGVVSCFGVLTPSASVPSPLFFGPGYITVKDTAIYNLVFIFLNLGASLFILWPLFQRIVI